MPTIEHGGRFYEVDEKGFLVDGSQWDPSWIEHCKTVKVRYPDGSPCPYPVIACLNADGSLTDEHYKIINFLQEYHRKNGFAPMARQISHSTNTPLGRIYELFPAGPGKGACMTAGLPVSGN